MPEVKMKHGSCGCAVAACLLAAAGSVSAAAPLGERYRALWNDEVNPLSYPFYEQTVVAEFASSAEASAATCEVSPLPDDARLAFSCRWDDTNPRHESKGRMMNRAGVKGSFYFVGESGGAFFSAGARTLMAMGHAIGNHTLAHPHVMTVNANAGFRQIAANRVLLETTIQHSVTSYVSPFGWQQDPLDPDRARTLAEALVASGHFVSEDGQMPWSGLSDRVWMWTNRFNADDRNPRRKLFVDGFMRTRAAALANRGVPRVTLGTHSWCDAKGEAEQESWLKEFFHPEDGVQMNDWEYGAYRYQFLHGGVVKTGTDGARATFRVKRYAAAYVGDPIALSLKFSVAPVRVGGDGRELVRAPRGTWTLPQNREGALMPEISRTEDGTLEVIPDEASAKLTLRFRNRTGACLRNLYFAAALPPKWSVRRVSADCTKLAADGIFERTFDMGAVRDAYAPGEAYYPVSVDFVRDGRPFRIWADRLMPRVEIPADAPAKVAQVWGPDRASKLADVDWTAVSVPGAALPDAQGWKRPSCPPDGLSTLVAAPIKTRGDGPEETALRELLKGADHARYVVYDFSASRDGRAVLRLNASPKYRAPTIYLNGVKSAFRGDRQAIAVRKGPNRLLLRADAVCGGYYTDTLYLDVEGK